MASFGLPLRNFEKIIICIYYNRNTNYSKLFTNFQRSILNSFTENGDLKQCSLNFLLYILRFTKCVLPPRSN